jgi:cytoskeletal protein CcmA (bactofilin family)
MSIHGRAAWRPLSLLILLLGLALALGATPAAALERRAGDSVGVPAGETVDDDLAIAGDTVTIGGRVTGDLFVAGGTVTLLPSAQIDGDVLAAGGALVINGAIGGDVRAAGASLQLGGTVGRNATVAGSQVTLGPNATIKGNWLSGSDRTLLQGTVEGNVTGGGSTVQLAGRVGRNVEVASERLLVEPSARVGGKLTYVSNVDQAVPDGTVRGQIERVAPPERPRDARRGFDVVGTALGLLLLAGSIVVGLLLAWLAPGLYRSAQAVLEQQALLAFGVGLVTLIVVPVLAIVLMVTVLGLPLGLLGLVAYFAGWYIGWLAAAAALAGLVVGLVRRQGRPVAVAWLVVLGLVGLHVLTRLPIVGVIIAFVVLCLGLGILVILIAERRRPPARPAPAGAPVG